MSSPNYKAMSPEERLKAWAQHREAVVVHQDGFAARPYNSRSRLDRKAWSAMEFSSRESQFIHRVAKSCGDPWAQKEA